MAFEFRNLDEQTRKLMLAEFERDGATASEYYGKRLNARGIADFPDLMRTAIQGGNNATLADALRGSRRLKLLEISHKKDGTPYEKSVPVNAPEVLAEGEFNRFYVRALCLRAIQSGSNRVTVYRARYSQNPRPESERLVGSSLDAKQLLEDVREHIGEETDLNVPGGPNSGLSVHL